jgi:hypothetical protein
MEEEKAMEFVKLLEEFIEDCGLDNITACNKAQELLNIINDK